MEEHDLSGKNLIMYISLIEYYEWLKDTNSVKNFFFSNGSF